MSRVVVWRISALATPEVPRHCPRCDAPRRFVSSDRFRVNAQKRRIDVWLIYRCPTCAFSWNATVVERSTPEAIGPEAYPRYQENDAATAWRCAFAVPGADRRVPVRVERPAVGSAFEAQLVLVDPVEVRLDRLLASELGLSRSEIARRARAGAIAADPRRDVVDGQVVRVS